MLYDRHINKQEMFLVYKILAYIGKLNISFLFNHYPKFSSSALSLFLHYLLNSYCVPGSLLDVSQMLMIDSVHIFEAFLIIKIRMGKGVVGCRERMINY